MEVHCHRGFNLIQNKLFILPPEGINASLVYDINIQLMNSLGLSSIYKLPLQILSTSSISLNEIPDISIVSPQNYKIEYNNILSSSTYYGLNSSISIVNDNGGQVPSWIIENKENYQLTITSKFKLEDTILFKFKFKIVDFCGNVHYTNIFKTIIYPNKPPIIMNSINNSTFYEGMPFKSISVASELFVDPGDTFTIYSSL